MPIKPNPKELTKVINRIKKAGPEKLHVLADFDRTLTKAYVNGKIVASLISILRDYNYLTPEYSQKAEKLCRKYFPIELAPNISRGVKKEAMQEWWTKHLNLLIKSGLSKNEIKKAMFSGKVKLRKRATIFFKLLKKNRIPLIILSSTGLGSNSIKWYLQKEKMLTSNIYVIANEFEWNNNGKATGFKLPIIHSMNKDETILKKFPIHKKIKDRKNVILLGDSPADVDMITGFNYDNLIKIGFLNENIKKKTQAYKKAYNVIIPNDGPMDYINSLINKIASK